MQDRDPAIRAPAYREVADDPSAVLLLEALAAGLSDVERSVRRAAADSLVALAPRHGEVQPLVRRALRGTHPDARRAALDVARRLGPPEPGWLPALVEALASKRGDERWTAARLLVDLGRLHGETAGVAAGLAHADERPVVRRMALFCAVELAPDDPSTRALLEQSTGDEDPEVRQAAKIALGAWQIRSGAGESRDPSARCWVQGR